MEIFLFIISGLLIILGLIGCIVPALPGPPLGYVGILCLHFTNKVQFTTKELVWMGIAMVAVSVLDYILPAWLTKRFGGSKLGVTGSIVGLIVGLFFAPIGIIVGPFIGAFVGELLNGNDTKSALKSGTGSFVGFILTTGLKLAVCGWYMWYFFSYLF